MLAETRLQGPILANLGAACASKMAPSWLAQATLQSPKNVAHCAHSGRRYPTPLDLIRPTASSDDPIQIRSQDCNKSAGPSQTGCRSCALSLPPTSLSAPDGLGAAQAEDHITERKAVTTATPLGQIKQRAASCLCADHSSPSEGYLRLRQPRDDAADVHYISCRSLTLNDAP